MENILNYAGSSDESDGEGAASKQDTSIPLDGIESVSSSLSIITAPDVVPLVSRHKINLL